MKVVSTTLRVPFSVLTGVSEADEAAEGRASKGKLLTAPPRNGETVTVELDLQLLEQAQLLGIDIPTALNAHLRELVGKARAEQWLKENRGALADANAFLAREGLWSDGKRQF